MCVVGLFFVLLVDKLTRKLPFNKLTRKLVNLLTRQLKKLRRKKNEEVSSAYGRRY